MKNEDTQNTHVHNYHDVINTSNNNKQHVVVNVVKRRDRYILDKQKQHVS